MASLLADYASSSEDEPQEIQRVKIKFDPSKDKIVAAKKFSDSPWLICLTRNGLEFFYNSEKKTSQWNVPEELEEMLNSLPPPSPSSTESSPKKRKRSESEPEDSDVAARIKALRKEQKAEQQRQEMSEKEHQQNVEGFKHLLREKKINPFGLWDMEVDKLSSDARFQPLDMEEKRSLFEAHCADLVEEAKELKRKEKEKLDSNFIALINEFAQASVKRLEAVRWEDFVKKSSMDPRYKAVKDHKEREALYQANWADAKRQAKPKVEKVVPTHDDSRKNDFFQLLQALPGAKVTQNTSWRDARRRLESMVPPDYRYLAFSSDKERESVYKEYLASLGQKVVIQEEDSKTSRQEAALKAREEEIRKQKLQSQQAKDHGRKVLQTEDALQTLKTMLVDLIKFHDKDYPRIHETLSKDGRFPSISSLSKSQMEQVFSQHADDLHKRRIRELHDLFAKLLSKAEWSPNSDHMWNQIRPQLLQEPVAEKLGSEVRSLFDDHLSQRRKEARQEFSSALKSKPLEFYVKKAFDEAEAEMEGEFDMDQVWSRISLEECLDMVKQTTSSWKILGEGASQESLLQRIEDYISQFSSK